MANDMIVTPTKASVLTDGTLTPGRGDHFEATLAGIETTAAMVLSWAAGTRELQKPKAAADPGQVRALRWGLPPGDGSGARLAECPAPQRLEVPGVSGGLAGQELDRRISR